MLRIESSHVVHKIFFQKYPATPYLGPGNYAALGALAQLLGMKVEKLGGPVKIKCAHDLAVLTSACYLRNKGIVSIKLTQVAELSWSIRAHNLPVEKEEGGGECRRLVDVQFTMVTRNSSREGPRYCSRSTPVSCGTRL